VSPSSVERCTTAAAREGKPLAPKRRFEELAERHAAVGDDGEAAMRVRKAPSEKHDIEVVGPPRRAAGEKKGDVARMRTSPFPRVFLSGARDSGAIVRKGKLEDLRCRALDAILAAAWK
jgi:hypothetical protein